MIDPFILGIGAATFLFGYIVSSNSDNKSSMNSIDTMLENNKELVSIISTVEILNRDIDKKNNLIADLKGEANQQQENIYKLINKADYLRNSGELEKLKELEKACKNITRIKENLLTIQKKDAARFNLATLISLVQTMYEHRHGEELDIVGVQHLMLDFTDTDSDSGGSGTVGSMKKKPDNDKKNKPRSPGV